MALFCVTTITYAINYQPINYTTVTNSSNCINPEYVYDNDNSTFMLAEGTGFCKVTFTVNKSSFNSIQIEYQNNLSKTNYTFSGDCFNLYPETVKIQVSHRKVATWTEDYLCCESSTDVWHCSVNNYFAQPHELYFSLFNAPVTGSPPSKPELEEIPQLVLSGGTITELLYAWNPEVYELIPKKVNLLITSSTLEMLVDNSYDLILLMTKYIFRAPATLAKPL